MKRVLIVGANGILGAGLVKYFESSEVIVLRSTRDSRPNANDHFFLDLLEPDQNFLNKIKKYKPECVIDCSGPKSITFCEDFPRQAEKIIVGGSLFLSKLCNRLEIPLVSISTSLVFDGQKRGTIRSQHHPENFYAELKSQAEHIILDEPLKNSVIRFDKVLYPSLPIIVDWSNRFSQGLEIEAFSDRFISPIPLKIAVAAIAKVSCYQMAGVSQLSASDQISYLDLAYSIPRLNNAGSRLIKPIKSSEKNLKPRLFTVLDSDRLISVDKQFRFCSIDTLNSVFNEPAYGPQSSE